MMTTLIIVVLALLAVAGWLVVWALAHQLRRTANLTTEWVNAANKLVDSFRERESERVQRVAAIEGRMGMMGAIMRAMAIELAKRGGTPPPDGDNADWWRSGGPDRR